MTYDERLKTTWPAVAERIAEAGRRARRTDPVVVVAVTKTHPVEAVIALSILFLAHEISWLKSMPSSVAPRMSSGT